MEKKVLKKCAACGKEGGGKMKSLLKKLLDTLACCLLAGSIGVFFAHEYERHRPHYVKIVCVDRPVPIPTRELSDIRVVEFGKKKMVRK